MSNSVERPYMEALRIAFVVLDMLRPACHRVELAGSLRRKRRVIGDIEIVAIPILQKDLFGKPLLSPPTAVDSILAKLDVTYTKNGSRMKQFTYAGMTVDLFLQPDPATWGINYLIRTGSADFSKWIVTHKQFGGAMPADLRVQDARLWRYHVVLDTSEEKDVFEAMGLCYIPPEKRHNPVWGPE